MGNTCFMSAVLHCLINCAQLQKLFLLDLAHPYQSCEAICNENRKGCLACEFDKAFLEYFGSAHGIDVIAALEESELGTSALSSSRFVQGKDTIYTRKREPNCCGYPIILSSFLAATWKHVGMKQLAGHNQNDAQEFFSSFMNALATSDFAYRDALKSIKQMSCPSQSSQSSFDEMKDKGPIGGRYSLILADDSTLWTSWLTHCFILQCQKQETYFRAPCSLFWFARSVDVKELKLSHLLICLCLSRKEESME